MKPLAVDLCAGLGGWADGLLAEGWDVVGFDIVRHEYGSQKYPAQLVLQDIRTLDGRQFRGKVSLIVASPPCQKYSYMSMPWTRAKDLARWYRDAEHPERLVELNALFNACLRIGHEAECPIVIENVRGAQPWVGRARWAFGSFMLWGDVPALMPATLRAKKRMLIGGGCHHLRGPNDPAKYWSTQPGVKQHGSGREWFAGEGKISRMTSSKSTARKAASAHIARIPFPLASWIARAWLP